MSAPAAEPWRAPLVGEPVPKVDYAELHVQHSDGSRTVIRYVPERNERMEVSLELDVRDEEALPLVPTGLVRFAERTDRHAVHLTNVAVAFVDHVELPVVAEDNCG